MYITDPQILIDKSINSYAFLSSGVFYRENQQKIMV